MKQVDKVSIGGYAFSLEKEASQAVAAYLKEMSVHYPNPEIVEGIEERMAELLLEKTSPGGVVTLATVQQIMGILGRPETIEEEEPERTSAQDEKPRKKLYRDMENARVAGVCSGLGTYFSIDPTIIRITFAVLTLIGFGFLLHSRWFSLPNYLIPITYLVLWICMPEAKTVQQRDELRGEKGTVDAISARIQSSAQEMGEVANNVVHSDFWKGLGRIFGLCIGIIFLVTGVAGVVSLGCVTVGDNILSNTFLLNRVIEEVANEAPTLFDLLSYPPLVASLAVVLVIPFIWLVYSGVMLLFDLKAPKWHPGLCLLVIWLIALTVLAVLSTMMILKGTI